ncbi:MAG TPA: chromate efflux transporter [Thermoanaerobaculia bacterium]|nr:chromate efflux transporter [Thermoanaerobaculia bacterium]HQN07167.1 chromate efflux transporter [Thermoanaerobaculia bacterium]HQP87867.1 chromate efflux transporter [Thermoanaerobaculia bacterium]
MERTTLGEIAAVFLRLGTTAFGGPAAHVAMMRDEVVRRRGWLTDAELLDLLSAANLIPGPNSTELAIHVGWARRRWAGLAVAGLSFILPAALITAALAWAYVRFGALPEADRLLWGVKPVILAVVVQAIVGLAPHAARTVPLRLLGIVAAVAAALGAHELVVLLGAGLLVAVVRAVRSRGAGGNAALPALGPLFPVAAGAAGLSAVGAVTLPAIFWLFCRTGAVLFGSGYVLVAFLRTDLVERLGWLTEAQLLDAVAAGQVTPGPVFTTATFVGWLLAGPAGAAAATAGIFLPAFVFVALSAPFVPRLRASRTAGAFLDGVNVASVALMAVVTARLAPAALVDLRAALLGLLAAVLLVRYRTGSVVLVLGGAAAGLIIGP